MSIYAELQGVAGGLLREFDQGGLVLLKQVPGSGPPHNPGPSTWVDVQFAGTARGVTGEHLKDTLIQSSDLTVVMPGSLTPVMADRIRIGSEQYSIVKIIPKPAAGTPAVYEVVVRK